VTGDWYYLRVEVVLSPREGSGAPFFLTRECRELSSLLFVFQVTADDLGDVRVLFSFLLDQGVRGIVLDGLVCFQVLGRFRFVC
jgi:hypothetical protein